MTPRNRKDTNKLQRREARSASSLSSKYTASALALILGAAAANAQTNPAPANAPAAADDETVLLSEFVVHGVRSSLIGAQETKQNANVFVDSIVAQDIGKLPDNTVADALQRIPGIQVRRNNGEVDLVLIRGLPNFGTTVNGHEIFTGVGRGVALQDIPAEFLQAVDVHKSTQPEHIEGGIAGLIDIRLRRPFDFKGLTAGVSTRLVYGENSEKFGYGVSAMVSNRVQFANKSELGALVGISYQRRRALDQRVFNFLFEPVPSAGVVSTPTIELPLTTGNIINPADRERPAYTVSLQYRPNQNLELYSDLLYMGYRNDWQNYFFIGFPRFGEFRAGSVYPGTSAGRTITGFNNFHLTSTQAYRDKTDGYQWVGGAKWTYDRLKLNAEVEYNWSSFKPSSIIVDTQFVPTTPATFIFDLNQGGAANVNITGADITSPANYRLWGLFDNRGYQTSEQKAFKLDGEYDISQGIFTQLKTGVRFSSRDAKARSSTRNDIAPADGRGVRVASTIPGFGRSSPDALFSKSEFGAQPWYGADPEFLYNNKATVRGLFGLGPNDPDFNPTTAYNLDEDAYAFYLQTGYKIDVGNMPLDGVVGARVVKTKQGITGFLQNGTPLNADKDETEVLPSLNGRLKLKDNLFFRYSAVRAITRPDFAALNPVASLQPATTTGGAFGTGSGGNPDLESVKSDNFDIALEYYFGRADYVALTGFYRSIDGYVQTFAATETINGLGYIVTRPRNAGEGSLKGLEFTYQHFFDFLPEAFRGFGVQSNFTYIEGDQDAADTRPGAPVGARVRQPYEQVSKYNYNLILIYERGKFSTRLAYNWRGKFVDTFNGPNAPGSPLRVISVKPTDRLDFSASYQLAKNLTVTFDVTNILNSDYKDYFSDASMYPRDRRVQDRTYELGLRYRY
jgi:iron complex outermembrane recepter protein